MTAGLFAAYRIGPFDVSGTVRQAILHSKDGLVGRVEMDYRWSFLDRKLNIQAGPEIDFGDSPYERTWFGVTPSQSVASGLPVFSPRGGIKDTGAHVSLTYVCSRHLLLRMFADCRRLCGDTADSPIVQKKNQVIVGFGPVYHF